MIGLVMLIFVYYNIHQNPSLITTSPVFLNLCLAGRAQNSSSVAGLTQAMERTLVFEGFRNSGTATLHPATAARARDQQAVIVEQQQDRLAAWNWKLRLCAPQGRYLHSTPHKSLTEPDQILEEL